jgi:hypothetical protein
VLALHRCDIKVKTADIFINSPSHLGIKMKSFIKIIVAALAIGSISFAMAANPAKGANGLPGYQAFCAALKSDCSKTPLCSYKESYAGKKDMSCRAEAYGDKEAISKFDKMCEGRGLKHHQEMPQGHAFDTKKMKDKYAGSACYVQ